MQLLLKFLARAAVAVAYLAALFVIGYLGGWLFFAAITAVALLALHEYYSALGLKGIRPNAKLGWVCAGLILLIAQYSENVRRSLVTDGGKMLGVEDLNVVSTALHLTLLVLLFCVAGTLVAQFRQRPGESAVLNSATTVFGVAYVGLLFSFVLRMRYVDVPALMGCTAPEFTRRMGALIFVVGPVWLGDTAAFLVGNLWGTHKLAPTISPGKTVQGSIAGLVAAVLGALVLGAWVGMPAVPAAALGSLMGTVGQLGDLSKSVLKRDLGIKDFGGIFGPHGGVLDRFDAVLFSMPLVYWYFWFLVMRVGAP